MKTYAKWAVIKHIPLNELRYKIRNENNKHIHHRLLFIYQLYLNKSVESACETLCVSVQTGYNWLKQWNERGYKGTGLLHR
jgi:putative transposase